MYYIFFEFLFVVRPHSKIVEIIINIKTNHTDYKEIGIIK
jgi:hypothetical protein